MSLGYVIKEGFSGIRRARLAAFTSIFSLFIAVLLLGVLARVSYNAYEVATTLKQSIDVEVFLLDLDQRTTGELQNRLENQELVQELTYVSKDSAAEIFRKEFGTSSQAGSALAELEFLPASFKLKIDSEATPEQVSEMVNRIEQLRGVDEVQFNRQLLEMLNTRFSRVAMTGGGVGLLILLTALILVYNTIRLTIYAKRRLIKAMKLVGATNSFIRRPFVVEGILQGLIAGLLAVGVHYLAFNYILPEYLPQFGVMAWPFGRWYYLSGAMVTLSLFMGFWGSLWAARKFIKRTSISQ